MKLARGNEFEAFQQLFESFSGFRLLVPPFETEPKLEIGNQQTYVDMVKTKFGQVQSCTEFSQRSLQLSFSSKKSCILV